MSAYILANVRVTDPEQFAKYSAQTPALMAAHGGRYLVRGGAVDPVEVDEPPGRLVVVEFESMDTARGYYHSDEYVAVRKLRANAAHCDLLLVEGVGS